MPKGDKVKKDKVEHGKGYKVKAKGKEHIGHVLLAVETYIIIHDAVTREHIKILLSDIDEDVDEVDATWLL
jgi:translation elongation factor EF-1beta